jgi:tetratricopeptide (TPR) repeat protein
MKTTGLILLFLHLADCTNAQSRTIDSLKNLIAIAEKDTSKIALYEKLGQAYRDEKKLDSAILSFKQSIAINQQTGYSLLKQCWNTGSIDYMLFETGNYLESLQYASRHLELSNRLNDTVQKGFAHLVFGHDYKGFGYYQQALNHYFQAKEFFKSYYLARGRPEVDTYTILCIGDVYLKMNRLDSALIYTQQAFDSARSVGHEYYILYALRLFGDIYTTKGNTDTAMRFYRQYVPLFYNSNENSRDVCFVYNNMAGIFQKNGAIDSAILYANKAFSHARQYSDQENLYRAALLLSDYYKNQNEPEAFTYFRIASAAKDSMLGSDKSRQAQLLHFNEGVRDKEIQEANKKEAARINRNIVIAELAVLIISFLIWSRIRQLRLRYESMLEQKELEKLKSKYEKELLELEAKALRAQMNPHFIFNSMNSIKALMQQGENEKAITYLTTFSMLIRTIFNNSDKRQITLFDEIDTCKLYLQLESLRFGRKLMYTFNIDETIDLKSIEIPALLFQPFIENAIWHGILPKESGGEVTVSVHGLAETITCKIEDNGVGRRVSYQNKAPGSQHDSKGLHLTQARLNLENFLTEQKAMITIIDKTSPDGASAGTMVEITLQPFV